MSADLVIVGGGPAGLTAAIHAAQRGLSSIVVDRRRPAPDDGCGEALMPSRLSRTIFCSSVRIMSFQYCTGSVCTKWS